MLDFCGKTKAVTFSYDDGVTQDIRLIELLNKYGLKCTFNVNSELLGKSGILIRQNMRISHYKFHPSDVKYVYEGHEVAAHTLTHPNLTQCDDAEVIRQVEKDRENLSEICGYEVVSMAYPCGGRNNDDRVAEIIKNKTGVRFARGLESTYSFDLQDNLYRFKPTVYYIESCLDEIVDKFLALESDTPALLYIWGHSYEMDAEYISWEKFDAVCKKLSGKDDIFYGTNKEVLLER